MAVQIQIRRGTAAAWTAANPVLAEGELGIETDTNKFKIGNGVDDWTTRPYAGGGAESDPVAMAALNDHLTDATDAHDASGISVVPFSGVVATNVQAALEEIAAGGGGGGSPHTLLEHTDVVDPATPAIGDFLKWSNITIAADPADYDTAVLADTPDAYYKFTEASGLPQDSSGNGKHVSAVNGTLTYGQAGPLSRNCIKFAAGAYMTLPAAVANGDGAFSIEFWAKKETSGNGLNPRLFSNPSASSHHYLIENGQYSRGPGMYHQEGGPSDPTPMSTTAFNHWVVVFNGGTVTVYKNGVQVDTASRTVTVPNGQWRIGSNGDNFHGWFSHVAMYSAALSAGQVLSHYNASAGIIQRWVPTAISSEKLVGARAFHSVNQAIANNVDTTLLLDSETYDYQGFHSTTANTERLTVPSGYDGTYQVVAQGRLPGTGGTRRVLHIKKNNNTIAAIELAPPTNANTLFRWQVLAFMSMVAGDYFSASILQDSGGSLDAVGGEQNVWLACHRIGA